MWNVRSAAKCWNILEDQQKVYTCTLMQSMILISLREHLKPLCLQPEVNGAEKNSKIGDFEFQHKSKKLITTYFSSLSARISRLAAVDSLPFGIFCQFGKQW